MAISNPKKAHKVSESARQYFDLQNRIKPSITRNMETSISQNAVVVNFGPNATWNQNSRLQLTVEDAAQLMAQLFANLSRHEPRNEAEHKAVNAALRRLTF